MLPMIDHLNRYVSDVDKFIDFYENVLGYKLIDRGVKENGSNYAILKGYTHEMFISEKNSFEQDSENFRHIGYSIDDVESFLNELKKKGYIAEEEQITNKKFSKQFYMKDPDGFEIDLIQWTDKESFYKSLVKKA